MEPQFKTGDCVQLIHGSPKMTVGKVEFSPIENVYQVMCYWFNGKKQEQREYPENVLKHCDE